MKRILVTGSEGSLAQSFIPKLIDKGYEVYGVDSLMRYGERRYIAPANYKFLRGDLADPYFVDEMFDQSRPNYIIQAAARIYGVGGFHSYPADILGQDVMINTNLLQSALEFGELERFVYISSSMVYENSLMNRLDMSLSEHSVDDAIIPSTDYGLSKLVGERLVKAYQKQYGIDYTIWRPFNIITPYEPIDKEIGVSHVFADFINNIVVKKIQDLPIIGTGNQYRCFTWIDDVSSIIANYSFDDRSLNDVFNIGNKEPITMKDLAGKICKIAYEMDMIDFDTLSFHTVKEYKDDVQIRIPSDKKLKEIFGWLPSKKVDDSIRACLEYLKVKLEKKDTIKVG